MNMTESNKEEGAKMAFQTFLYEKPIPTLEYAARDYPFDGDDVCPVSAFAAAGQNFIHERSVNVSYETVRAWWNRPGPVAATEIRKRWIQGCPDIFPKR
jgi:hypothetical protein